jgi:hypothetical protein
MKATFYQTFIFILIAYSLSCIQNGFAQTENVQPKFKQVFIHVPKVKVAKIPPKDYKPIIDSLSQAIQRLDSNYHEQLIQLKAKDSIITELNLTQLKQQPVIIDLKQRTSEYSALNTQITKSNIILLSYNAVVCIFLLILLFQYFLKSGNKKKAAAEKPEKQLQENKLSSAPVKPSPDVRFTLAQFEKLGKLRREGILTEKEFAIQKELILKNSN